MIIAVSFIVHAVAYCAIDRAGMSSACRRWAEGKSRDTVRLVQAA